MATNEQEVPEGPTPAQQVLLRTSRVLASVTDTGPSTGVSLRVWVIFAILGLVAGTHPVQWIAVVGVVTLVALALTLGSRSRGPRP